MGVDTIIKNCKIVTPTITLDAGIAIDEGKIVAIGRDRDLPSAWKVIDAKGNYAMPGLVDAHIHMQYPPGVPLEANIKRETQACAVGGCTTAIHLLAPCDDIVAGATEFVAAYEKCGYVDLSLSARIYTLQNIKQMRQAAEHGIHGFKLLMPYKGSEAVWKGQVGGIDDGIIYLAFKEIGCLARQGYPVFARVHCENIEIFFKLKEKLREEGTEPYTWNEVRPGICEEEAMRRCIYLAGITGCPLYVVHLTIKGGIELIRKARAEGVNVVAETCPQYLVLNTDNTDKVLSKVNPPIRPANNNEPLWEGIRLGIISVVATDHAPVPKETKTNLWDAIVGIPGEETWLPIMLSEGINKGRISLEKLVEVCCYNPARIFGLTPAKGMIAVGSDADIVLVDLEKESVVLEKPIYSGSNFSPWAGWRLKGWPILTMLRGKVVAEDGKVVGEPGYGRYIKHEQR